MSLLCTSAQIQFASGSRDALLAATLVRSATADFMCKECVTALAEKILLAHIESPMRLIR
jgi:hypothetical protein